MLLTSHLTDCWNLKKSLFLSDRWELSFHFLKEHVVSESCPEMTAQFYWQCCMDAPPSYLWTVPGLWQPCHSAEVQNKRGRGWHGSISIVVLPHSTHSHPICSDVCSPDCVTSPTAPVTWLQRTHNTKLPRNSSWNKVASKWTALLWRENSLMQLCCILSLSNKNYMGDKGHLKMWIRNTEIVGNAD